MKINGIPVYEGCYGSTEPGKYFLIRVAPQQRAEYYTLSRQPGRTNMSREERLKGWLGETNNVSRYAEGAIEVFKTKNNRLRACTIDAEKLDDEREMLV